MDDPSFEKVDPAALIRVMEVTRKLSAPFELDELLEQVVEVGREVLHADRGSIFLFDPIVDELYSTIATGSQQIRFSIAKGIAGQCARTREVINVPDCYSDARFNPEIDRATGYRTRSLIAMPLVGLDQELVGVLQMLNPTKPSFDRADERIALVLASQVATAIQRTRLLEERIIKLKLESDLEVARQIQMDVLPRKLPDCPGYDIASFIHPADQTGGDLYDLIALPPGPDDDGPGSVVILLADATGHGVGPALSVTQVRALLRMGVRLGAGLDALLTHLNLQLSDDLTSCRIVTAFIGVFDPVRHRVEYHAAGQGPLLHYHAADQRCQWFNASTVPLGIADGPAVSAPPPIVLAPGDCLALLTDGIYEYRDGSGEAFDCDRVGRVFRENSGQAAQVLLDSLLVALDEFGGDAPQLDDLTALIIRRHP